MSEKLRNKDLVDDDRWKKKGGAHRCPVPEPSVCPDCDGRGYIQTHNYNNECFRCDGTGEIWE